jgi:hypothetical protein
MNPNYAHLEGVPTICRFLDAHRNITSFRILAVWNEWYLSIVPSVRARNLQIRCGGHYLVDLFALLRPEVKILDMDFGQSKWGDCLAELFVSLQKLRRQFAAEDDARPTLEEIRLCPIRRHIDDDSAPTISEGFLSSLRVYTHPLKARGIRVFAGDCEF